MAMIYKYLPSTSYSLTNLRQNSIYFRHPSQFNDAFEFWVTHRKGIPQLSFEKARFIEVMRAWGWNLDGADEELQQYTEHKEYFEEVNDYEPDFSLLHQRTRIACFCADSLNLLMWSHYADGMRGFCLGFDPQLLSQIAPACYLTNVNYCRNPPAVDSFVYAIAWDQHEYLMMAIEEGQRAGSNSNMTRDYQEAADMALKQIHSIWQRAFASKPVDWAYEKEIRLMLHSTDTNDQGELVGMPRGALKEVIVGERMEEDYKERLLDAVLRTFGDIPIKEARRMPQSYDIGIE